MAPLWSTLSRVKLLSLPFCLFINLFLTEYQSARTDKNKTKTSAPRSDGRWASWLYIYVYKLSRTFQQKWSFQMNLKFISCDAILHLLTYETLLKQEESKKLYCNICSCLFFSLFLFFCGFSWLLSQIFEPFSPTIGIPGIFASIVLAICLQLNKSLRPGEGVRDSEERGRLWRYSVCKFSST